MRSLIYASLLTLSLVACKPDDDDAPPPPPVVTCEYSGVEYDVGESFPATDGCNTCGCGEGGVVGCTKIGCACDPEVEPNRNYVGTPDECMAIRYACPENTTPFQNDCGCGCEQPDTCPEWYNCEPRPGVAPCDAAALRAECPYSGIAF